MSEVISTKERALRYSGRWVVYALTDPRAPDSVRYVGLTGDLAQRWTEHQRAYNRGLLAPWVADLAAAGLRPEMRVLSTYADKRDGRIAEFHAIKDTRAAGGCDLNAPTPCPADYYPNRDLEGADALRARIA